MAFGAATSGGALLFGLSAIATGVQVAAQIAQGRQEAAMFEYNARVAQQQAEMIRRSAAVEVDRQRRRAREFTASQEAAYAASGVRLVGSPMEVIINSAAELAMDMEITKYNARVEELNALTSAQTSLMKAQQARTSSYINAGSTLLSQTSSFLRFGRANTAKVNTKTFESKSVPRSTGGIPQIEMFRAPLTATISQ